MKIFPDQVEGKKKITSKAIFVTELRVGQPGF